MTIITVTFNNDKNITQFLNSITKNFPKNCELIIVDNNSSDKTVEKILEFKKKKNLDLIKLIEMSKNVGFAKANNVGANLALYQILLFLNSDTLVTNEALVRLEEFIEENADAGIVGPQLIRKNGQTQPSVKNFPTLSKAIREYLFGIKYSYSEYIPETQKPVIVESIYGTCIMMKKNIFDKLEGFNEKYFLYYEDLDLCEKVRNLGLKIYYLPEVKIIHFLGGSNDRSGSDKKGGAISEFFPIKESGRRYFQIKSSNIFHGVLISFLIHFVIFISQVFRKNKQ